MSVTLKPTGKNVAVRPLKPPDFIGAIAVPDEYKHEIAKRLGVVEAIGPDVDMVAVGDEVAVTHGMMIAPDFTGKDVFMLTAQEHCVCVIERSKVDLATPADAIALNGRG